MERKNTAKKMAILRIFIGEALKAIFAIQECLPEDYDKVQWYLPKERLPRLLCTKNTILKNRKRRGSIKISGSIYSWKDGVATDNLLIVRCLSSWKLSSPAALQSQMLTDRVGVIIALH